MADSQVGGVDGFTGLEPGNRHTLLYQMSES